MATGTSLLGDPEVAAAAVLATHESGWVDRFVDAIDRRRSGEELSRVQAAWQLSDADVARLFGVSRQAVAKWIHSGVPAERARAVGDLASMTDLLVRHLKRERIPAVVRRPADVLEGHTLLELAALDTGTALVRCRAMFDFTAAHA